jgi:hypothetical protein
MVYMPPEHPPNAPVGEDGFEEWSRFVRRWSQDLRKLHDEIIPEDCYYGHVFETRHCWERFLSGCVMYDPPDKELEEFVSQRLVYRKGHRDSPYVMSVAPIRSMKDWTAVEDACLVVLSQFADNIIQRHEQDPEKDVAELIREAFSTLDSLTPVFEHHHKNPPKPFIEVQPWHTEEDIRNAFRLLRGAQQVTSRRGRPKRDELRAVQCAIFADRYGWTEEQVSDHYGWKHYGKAGKYIREGRRILKAL